MTICAIVGCSNRSNGASVFGLPSVITNQCEKTRELSSRRRAEWLARINRDFKGRKLSQHNIKVCQRHFISGKPSKLFDHTNPDWAPSLNLGYDLTGKEIRRHERFSRAQKRQISSLISFSLAKARRVDTKNQTNRNDSANSQAGSNDVSSPATPSFSSGIVEEEPTNLLNIVKEEPTDSVDVVGENGTSSTYFVFDVVTPSNSVPQEDKSPPTVVISERSSQTDLKGKEIERLHAQLKQAEKTIQALQAEVSCYYDHEAFDKAQLVKDNIALRSEARALKLDLNKVSLGPEYFQDDAKVAFYTGIPSYDALRVLFDFLSPFVAHSSKNVLPQFSEFMVTMMRLHLGLFVQDLAYRFNVSPSTLSKILEKWTGVISREFSKFILWPERKLLRDKVPKCFEGVFDHNLIGLMDCYERLKRMRLFVA